MYSADNKNATAAPSEHGRWHLEWSRGRSPARKPRHYRHAAHIRSTRKAFFYRVLPWGGPCPGTIALWERRPPQPILRHRLLSCASGVPGDQSCDSACCCVRAASRATILATAVIAVWERRPAANESCEALAKLPSRQMPRLPDVAQNAFEFFERVVSNLEHAFARLAVSDRDERAQLLAQICLEAPDIRVGSGTGLLLLRLAAL